MIGDWNQDDGNVGLIPQMWTVRGGGVSTKNIQEIIAANVKEVNDELIVAGTVAGKDNYVREGQLDDDANLQLELGEGKTVDISLSKLNTTSLSTEDIIEASQQ